MKSLGIPFSALVSVIFGLMILSFPVGAYVVFNSNIEDGVRYDFPINGFNFFPAGIGIEIPIEIEIGDAFIGLWSLYVFLFSIAMFGPKVNFLKALSPIMSEGKYEPKSNYLVSIIKWFSILIVISGIINLIQESIGITTLPPVQPDSLIQFFEITVAPISEEIGFRVMLIGIPLFLMYSNRGSIILFFKTLWHPTHTLHIYHTKKILILITLVGIFFGAAHIISGESWSLGKFAQASASGIIIGWVYFKHGLISAIMVHWATNYFIYSYVNFLAEINDITVKNAFSHSLTNSLEILFIMAGILSLALIIINYLNVKNKKPLEI